MCTPVAAVGPLSFRQLARSAFVSVRWNKFVVAAVAVALGLSWFVFTVYVSGAILLSLPLDTPLETLKLLVLPTAVLVLLVSAPLFCPAVYLFIGLKDGRLARIHGDEVHLDCLGGWFLRFGGQNDPSRAGLAAGLAVRKLAEAETKRRRGSGERPLRMMTEIMDPERAERLGFVLVGPAPWWRAWPASYYGFVTIRLMRAYSYNPKVSRQGSRDWMIYEAR